jgi:hypothetical protein
MRSIFYSNPDDPALLVPKRFGIGYTVNFGHPWSWIVIAFIILIVLLPLIVAGLGLHQLPIRLPGAVANKDPIFWRGGWSCLIGLVQDLGTIR